MDSEINELIMFFPIFLLVMISIVFMLFIVYLITEVLYQKIKFKKSVKKIGSKYMIFESKKWYRKTRKNFLSEKKEDINNGLAKIVDSGIEITEEKREKINYKIEKLNRLVNMKNNDEGHKKAITEEIIKFDKDLRSGVLLKEEIERKINEYEDIIKALKTPKDKFIEYNIDENLRMYEEKNGGLKNTAIHDLVKRVRQEKRKNPFRNNQLKDKIKELENVIGYNIKEKIREIEENEVNELEKARERVREYMEKE